VQLRDEALMNDWLRPAILDAEHERQMNMACRHPGYWGGNSPKKPHAEEWPLGELRAPPMERLDFQSSGLYERASPTGEWGEQ
jgi:hypothetical protein